MLGISLPAAGTRSKCLRGTTRHEGRAAVVLLQQYAVIFATRSIGIRAVVAGLFLGILLPTYGRVRAVKKAYRRTS